MSGPDQIWAWPWEARPSRGQWSSAQEIVGEGGEYIRLAPDVIAALPEVQALIAEAVKAEREACAMEAEKRGWPPSMTVDQYASISNAVEAEFDCGTEIAATIRKRGEGKP